MSIEGHKLREKVLRCQRLAEDVTDPRTVAALTRLAHEYEEELARLEGRPMRVPNEGGT